jgi:hypothetical protein
MVGYFRSSPAKRDKLWEGRDEIPPPDPIRDYFTEDKQKT